jgi:GAF domain-containing protein
MNEQAWELSGQQCKALRLVLEGAFPTISALKRMVRENLEEYLAEMAEGGNLRDIISNLLTWAEAQNRVRELVISAAYENPRNALIQEFVEVNIEKLIEFKGDPLPEKALPGLFAIIKSIEFSKIWEIGKNIIADASQRNFPEEIQALNEPNSPNWLKCFILLKLLIEDYQVFERNPSILYLVKQLLQKIQLSNAVKNSLDRWLNEVSNSVQPLPDLDSRLSQEISSLELQIQKTVNNLRQERSRIIKQVVNITQIQWLDDLRKKYKKALSEIARNISIWMSTERTTIYFLNDDKDELWSIFAQGSEENGRPIEISLRVGDGISGRVARYGQISNIPYPAHECEHSEEILRQDDRNNFKTYTLLTIPIKNEANEVFAVFQFVNRLRRTDEAPISMHEQNYQKYSSEGFTIEDERRFIALVERSMIRIMMEGLQDYYNLAQQLRSSVKSNQAAQLLSQNIEDFSEALQQIMKAAKELMNADRSTLWVLDHAGERLWTQIPSKEAGLREVSIEVGKGFAGRVAIRDPETEKYLTENIPFDLYSHPLSATAQQYDQANNYRTYNLLCMPVTVHDEHSPGKQKLVGVTQLLNKFQDGFSSQDYNANGLYQKTSECFETSFDKDDERRMEAFNAQAAIVLQSAQRSTGIEPKIVLFGLLKQTAEFVSELLPSGSAIVYLFDERENKLWSITEVSRNNGEVLKILEFAKEEEPAWQVAVLRKDLFIHQRPETPRSKRDLSKIIFPLFDYENKLLAVIEARHKFVIKNRIEPIETEDNYQGFSHTDKEIFFNRYFESLLSLAKSCHTFYETLNRQTIASKLIKAQRMVLVADRENYVEKVMRSARELVNADRCTLWRLDIEHNILNAEGYVDQEGLRALKLRMDVGSGYVGKAAQIVLEQYSINKELPFLKVDCDLYKRDKEQSQAARKIDRETKYRTCSLLCMPILDKDEKLLGILQLVNKLRSGIETLDDYSLYLPTEESPTEEVPPCFDASFDTQDIRQLRQFNRLVGGLIYEEMTLAEVQKKTEEMQ